MIPERIKREKGTINVTREKENNKRLINQTHEYIDTMPEPPTYLGKIARAEWESVWDFLIKYKVAVAVDVAQIAAYCCEVESYAINRAYVLEKGHLIYDSQTSKMVANPALGLCKDSLNAMLNIASKIGFNPAARFKMSGAAISKEAKQPTAMGGLLKKIHG